MTALILSLAGVTLAMAVVTVTILLVFRAAGGRLGAKCRYTVWMLVTARLCIPLSLFAFPALLSIPLPETVSVGYHVINNEENPPITRDTTIYTPAETSADGAVAPVADLSPQTGTDNFPGESGQVASSGGVPSPADVLPPSPEPGGKAAAAHAGVTLSAETLMNAAFAVWLAAAVTYFGVKIIIYAVFSARMRQSLAPPDPGLLALYKAECDLLKIRRRPALFICDGVDGAMMFGYFSPVIVCSPSVTRGDAASLILRHELTHYRRGDVWAKLLILACRSLNWFNPAAQIAASRAQREMELSCDERVLAGCGDAERAEYGGAMLSIVRSAASRQLYM